MTNKLEHIRALLDGLDAEATRARAERKNRRYELKALSDEELAELIHSQSRNFSAALHFEDHEFGDEEYLERTELLLGQMLIEQHMRKI